MPGGPLEVGYGVSYLSIAIPVPAPHGLHVPHALPRGIPASSCSGLLCVVHCIAAIYRV